MLGTSSARSAATCDGEGDSDNTSRFSMTSISSSVSTIGAPFPDDPSPKQSTPRSCSCKHNTTGHRCTCRLIRLLVQYSLPAHVQGGTELPGKHRDEIQDSTRHGICADISSSNKMQVSRERGTGWPRRHTAAAMAGGVGVARGCASCVPSAVLGKRG
jgi:hypothetical protein